MAKAAGSVTVVESVVLVLVIMIMWAPLHVAEYADHRCRQCNGFQRSCLYCDPGRCCSPHAYCGSGLGYCTLCYCRSRKGHKRHECHFCHCRGNCKKQPPYRYPNASYSSVPDLGDDDGILTVIATYDHRYLNSISTVSDNSGSAATATITSSRRQHRYGSAAICEPLSSSSSSSSNTTTVSTKNVILPGQCLQVTNLENGRQATVRITDKQYNRNDTSLVLDHDVFQHLDTSDKRINVGGNLTIAYKRVRCVHN